MKSCSVPRSPHSVQAPPGAHAFALAEDEPALYGVETLRLRKSSAHMRSTQGQARRVGPSTSGLVATPEKCVSTWNIIILFCIIGIHEATLN